MKDGDKDTVRVFEETDSPVFIVTFNIQKFCHRLEEQTEDDDVVKVKIRPTKPFLVALNERVFDLLEESIHKARSEGRTNLMAQDVRPTLDGEKMEDDS